MFHPLREGGKLGAFNYKQINPFAKYGFIPLNSLPHFGYLTASPRSARRSSSLREGGDVRVNAEILNVYISPSGGCGRDGGGGCLHEIEKWRFAASLLAGNYTRG